MVWQKTIKNPVETVGIGLHKNNPIKLRLEPLPVNSGIVFYREDLMTQIPLKPEYVVNTTMATVIGNGKANISTIEHLLSCVYAFGVDNLKIIVDADEIPIMDGSANSFCLLFQEAGLKEQDVLKEILKIQNIVEVRDGDKYVKLLPSKEAIFDFKIDFKHPVIGKEKYSFNFSLKNYLKEIAPARTFGFTKDLQYLQNQNLAQGASLQNVIALDESKILNPEGLRYPNEFVRHKILDALGDLMVCGYNILGKYEAFAGSHHLNALLVQKLLSDVKNFSLEKTVEAEDLEIIKEPLLKPLKVLVAK
jgi:UDP-3-O-[3-hydroxymyristoyl] N-acetylglucosamine deacetylase